MLKVGRSQRLYQQAKKIIPGGTQLLSKRPEMFLPGFWPAYYSKAKGCEAWDLDGNRYTDMSYMGIGSCILGYADEEVNKAVADAVKNGSMSTLNPPEEVSLAKLMFSLHPWADMARYARTGGEAMAIAVRIARAYSGKDTVLFCGYHGWHDWYLASNLADERSLDGHLLPGLDPLGVPRQLKGAAAPFNYNDTAGFQKTAFRLKRKIGAIVLESVRNYLPDKRFFQAVRKTATALKAPLIIDEITAGWRLNAGGAHMLFGLEPDIAVFAKGISNGFPMAVVIGKKKVMSCAQRTFISSSFWTERIGPVAAIATINKIKQRNVPAHLVAVGKRVQEGWGLLAAEHNLKIDIAGIYPLGHFSFRHKDGLALKTLFTQSMLEQGFLATTAFYASYAHKDSHIQGYLKAVGRSFALIAKAISGSGPRKYLKGEICQSGFKRLS